MMLRDLVIFWAGIVTGSAITGWMAILAISRTYREKQ